VWGLVFGVAFAAIRIVVDVLLTLVVRKLFSADASVPTVLLTVVGLVTMVPCVAIAGFLAGALCRRFLSGFIAGVVVVVVTQGLSLFLAFTEPSPLRVGGALMSSALQLVVTLLYLLLGAGVGAGCGAIGALVGQAWKRRSPSLPAPV
jgi:hypothetical protein